MDATRGRIERQLRELRRKVFQLWGFACEVEGLAYELRVAVEAVYGREGVRKDAEERK